MSNLYKQYNTVEPEKSVRMIDYNPLVEQKLAELKKGQQSGGFQALDLTAAEEIEIKEDPIEIAEKLKSEAEETLNRAKAQAETLLAQAQAQADELLRQAKEDGQKEGYETGFREAKEEVDADYEHRKEELEQFRLSLQSDYNREMHELEPKLLDTILAVVEKVFHIQFDDKREILLYLVGNAIAHMEGCKSFRIRVGEEQKAFLEYHREEISDRVGHDMSLEIVSDLSLQGNQCIIETETGFFDCSLGVQLENLIKDLRSLCS